MSKGTETRKFYQCPDHGTILADAVKVVNVHAYGCGAPVRCTRETRPFGGSAVVYTCEVHGKLSGMLATRDVWQCRRCGQATKVREITFTVLGAGEKAPARCGGRCTSGKRACDCQCGGICHGRGECICNTAEGRELREHMAERLHAGHSH